MVKYTRPDTKGEEQEVLIFQNTYSHNTNPPNNNKNESAPSNREIMSESYSRRSWKGMACAVLVIAAMGAIIAVIVVYAGPSKETSMPGTLELKDVINRKYSAKSFNGSWLTDTTYSFLCQSGNLRIFDVTTLNSTIFVTNTTMHDLEVESYAISADQKFVLFSYNSSKVYRHSAASQYVIYEVSTNKTTDLHGGKYLQYAAWGPNESQLVFVYENNVWYKHSTEQQHQPVQITTDGVDGIIYNGVPDWVYEEEVLSSDNAIYWSPDGTKFSFIKFDDTNVPIMNYMKYGSFEDPKNVYPEVLSLRYPKPGRTNPTVTLFVVDVSQPSVAKEMKPPTEINGEYYISDVTWATSNLMSVTWIPRTQNTSLVSLCKPSESQCVKDSLEKSSGWVDSGITPIYTEDGSAYFIIKPYEGNYRHLAMHSVENRNITFLTTGTYEVTSILFYNSKEQTVYFTRTEVNNPASRQIARVNISVPLTEDCLTCSLDSTCKNFAASPLSFSKDGTYMVLRCAGGETMDVIPYVDIRKMPHNELVTRLEDNSVLKEKLSNQTLCDYKIVKAPIAGSSYEAIIRLYLPKDFDESKKYPLLISVYGGPDTQAVINSFSVNFGTYLASVRKFIYAEVDGRGSAFRGNNLRFEMYKKLGTVEIEDQITAARYLATKYRYIDGARMAVWGWSYGGYAAGLALATGDDTFKCGMSVAPVTSWYYYDSIYTERYMLTPQDNLEAYNSSDLLKRASMFLNKKYLLIHGTGDDNVHVQQSMMFMKALNKAGVLYDTHIYPDEAHSISDSTVNVYLTLEQFVQECFQ